MSPAMIIDIVRSLVRLILDLVPLDVAWNELSEESIRRQNAIANLAEKVKFPDER